MAARDLIDRSRGAVEHAVENGRRTYENLNDRERKLVAALGVVLLAIVVLLPLYLMNSAISDLEEENRDVVALLRDIDRARPMLRQREAEREAAMKLYERKAPPLGSFLEQEASKQGLTVRELNDQPEKDLGNYRRRHVRVTLPNVGLASVVRMMASIKNSPFPVSLERIHVDHFQTGDRYNVQLGVVAFDRKGGPAEAKGEPTKKRRPAKRPRRGGRSAR